MRQQKLSYLVADTCCAPVLSCKLHAVLILLTRNQATIIRKCLHIAFIKGMSMIRKRQWQLYIY